MTKRTSGVRFEINARPPRRDQRGNRYMSEAARSDQARQATGRVDKYGQSV